MILGNNFTKKCGRFNENPPRKVLKCDDYHQNHQKFVQNNFDLAIKSTLKRTAIDARCSPDYGNLSYPMNFAINSRISQISEKHFGKNMARN